MRTRVVMALLMSLVVLASCGRGQAAHGVPETDLALPPAPEGERFTLQRLPTTEWKDVGGEFTSVDMAEARARIPGVLATLTVSEGDTVAKGQVIGTVVDARLGHEASAFSAQAAAAQAQVAQAEAELKRVKYLLEKGVYSQARLDQAEAALKTAKAQESAALAQRAAVGAVAGQGAVLAPSAGKVLVADVPPGSAVSPGMAIATITSGQLVLRLNLPESLAQTVSEGSAVLVSHPSSAAGAAPITTVIKRIYPSIRAGQFTADVDVANLDDALVGQRVAARVAIGQRDALIVPRAFVVNRFGIEYVTLLTADGLAATVPVQTAPLPEAGKVEILSGADAGDILISEVAD
jgi:RND family efflux transporter MFP subunit